MTEDDLIRQVVSLGAKQRTFLYTDRLFGVSLAFPGDVGL